MNNTGPNDRAQRWVRERWPAIRARGFTRFLLLKGLLLWGGILFAAMTALMIFQLGIDHPRLPLVIGMAALLCAIGGLVWASLTWWINERIFRSLTGDKTA